MLHVHTFTFNPFAENTYLLYTDEGEALIIDPGCQSPAEQRALSAFITAKKLTVKGLLNTHCHIDHVFGNQFVKDTYGVSLAIHRADVPLLRNCTQVAAMYGIQPYQPSEADTFLEAGQIITLGAYQMEVWHTPGHAPGHVVFVHHEGRWLIGGDVLFRESIGRTDFPMCNHEDLIRSIKTQLFALDDDFVVYPGHGITTTIGHEKRHNPFLD